MKKYILLISLITLGITTYAQRAKKVVFVIADGIPADVLESLELPNIKRIVTKGSYNRMYVGGEKGGYSETPTISAVGYNSLLTGTWVNKHNVPDNDIKAPNYHYQNIFRLLKAQYPQKKTAIFSSWTDNRTKLLGHNLPEAGNLTVDKYFDGYELDTVRFKHDKERNFMHQIDEEVIKNAATELKATAPDLSWVYLEYTDDMGHMYGDSPQFTAAIKMLDTQLGKLYDAISYREKNFKEDWLLVVTTDHGRGEKDGRGHGGQSARQRSTWMVSNYANLNDYAGHYKLAIVDIMPSIARFMNLTLPNEVMREVDGTPFIGPVSIANVECNAFQDKIDIGWKALENKGNLKIWVSATNNFKTGGTDEYQLLADLPVKAGHATVNVAKLKSNFYKIVLEAPANTVNKWIVLDQKK